MGDACGPYLSSQTTLPHSSSGFPSGGSGARGRATLTLLLSPPNRASLAEVLGLTSLSALSFVEREEEEEEEEEEGVFGRVSDKNEAPRLRRHAIQRYFLSALGDPSSVSSTTTPAGTSETGATPVGVSSGGQYTLILNTYTHSLAALAISTYLLGLGRRRIGGVYLTPSGNLFMSDFSFHHRGAHPTPLTRAKHNPGAGTFNPPSPTPRLFHPTICAELLEVLGVEPGEGWGAPAKHPLPPPALALMEACKEAFAALYTRSQEVLTILGASMVRENVHYVGFTFLCTAHFKKLTTPTLFSHTQQPKKRARPETLTLSFFQTLPLPGANSPTDVEDFKARLFLDLSKEAAVECFEKTMAHFLCLS